MKHKSNTVDELMSDGSNHRISNNDLRKFTQNPIDRWLKLEKVPCIQTILNGLLSIDLLSIDHNW